MYITHTKIYNLKPLPTLSKQLENVNKIFNYSLQILQFKNVKFKGIRVGVRHLFGKLILFNRLFFKLPDACYSLTKFDLDFEIEWVKAGVFNRFLMEGTN